MAAGVRHSIRRLLHRPQKLPSKLSLARQQVEKLVLDKARLVEKYEKELSQMKMRLHDSQSHGELHAATQKQTEASE